jgi:Spy/CpxP family protein refolding chaperone
VTRIVAAALVAAAALLAAPQAVADPQDLVPYCSGDQTPMDNNCRPMAHQEFTHGSGLDPDLPSGLDPANEPVVGGD